MSAKKPYLITLTAIAEVDDTEAVGPSELERVCGELANAVDGALGHPARPLGWNSLGYVELDPATVNCGQCEVCRAWCTDRDRADPEPEPGLPDGARVDGRLLCAEHLPPGHPWGYE